MAVAHRRPDGVCILDALHEVIGPCDPVKAARECAALAGRYSITRLVLDKYAGQWPVQAFLECGLILEQSAKPKSDLYHDFLPLLNSAQVRLLEHRRLRSQLVNLERRVARSGRDSIDHPKGGRDDVVNSAAGVLVGLFLDRRPALVRQSDLLASGVALSLPKFCKYLIAVLTEDSKTGRMSIVYSARMPDDPLHMGPKVLILDFDAGPMRASLFSAVAERVRDLAAQCRSVGGAVLMVPASLAKHAAAANHAAAGNVKLCVPAAEKAKVAPFHGALDFRAGEGADDPLRGSLVLTIALALDQQ